MSQKFLTYYELLGVATNASSQEIDKAYKAAAKLYHPDKQENSESSTRLFQYLNEAREVLLNSEKRKQYDEVIGGQSKKVPIPKVIFKDRIVLKEVKKNDPDQLFAVGILCLLAGAAIMSGNKK